MPALDYNFFQPTFFHLLICNQIQLLAISSFSDSISTVFCLLFWSLNKRMYVTFYHSFLTIHYVYTFDLFILISCILDWFPIPIFKGYWWTILLSLFCYLASLLNIHTINIYISKISTGYFFNNKIISLIFLRIWNFANLNLLLVVIHVYFLRCKFCSLSLFHDAGMMQIYVHFTLILSM